MTVKLHNYEAELLLGLLETLADHQSNAGCNDWFFPLSWGQDAINAFMLGAHTHNGEPAEDFEPSDRRVVSDFVIVHELMHRITEQMSDD